MLPSFDAEPIRPDKAPDVDQEVFHPGWQCFCCHDSGLVNYHLVKLVITKYDDWHHKMVACQRCAQGQTKLNDPNYDQRFNWKTCNELDTIERQQWADFAKAQQRQINLERLNKTMTMPGAAGRTEDDNLRVQQKKQDRGYPP